MIKKINIILEKYKRKYKKQIIFIENFFYLFLLFVFGFMFSELFFIENYNILFSIIFLLILFILIFVLIKSIKSSDNLKIKIYIIFTSFFL